MPRKLYTRDEKRGSPFQGIKIRHHPNKVTKGILSKQIAKQGHLLKRKIQRTLFQYIIYWRPKPREGETDDLLFRRLISCRVKREREYGIKEVLKMKKVGMRIDINGRCNKICYHKSSTHNMKRKNLIDFSLIQLGMISFQHNVQPYSIRKNISRFWPYTYQLRQSYIDVIPILM